MWQDSHLRSLLVAGAMSQEGTVVVMTVSECCDHIDRDTTDVGLG